MLTKILLDTFDVVSLINGYNNNQAFFKELLKKEIEFCLSRGSSFELSDKKYAEYSGQIRLIHNDLNITDLPPTWDLFLKSKTDKESFSNSFLRVALPKLWANFKNEDFFENYFKSVFIDTDSELKKHFLAILARDKLESPFKLRSLSASEYEVYGRALAQAFVKDVEIRDKNISIPKIVLSLPEDSRPRRDSSGMSYFTSYSKQKTGITIKEFNKKCGKFAYIRYCAAIHLSMIGSNEKIVPTVPFKGGQFKPISEKEHHLDFQSDLKARLLCMYAIKMQIQKNIPADDRNTQVDGTRLMHLPDVTLLSVDHPVYSSIKNCRVLPPYLSEKLLPPGYIWCYLLKKYATDLPESIWPDFLDPKAIKQYIETETLISKSAYVDRISTLNIGI